ncbi:hypothetical protein A3Q56_02661 [Intoshia linei]|uniref:Ubiquitin carboxyl-terminal hydrolase n=1 Tax=Intoshia linei TaxID=1819745 RepID=A0A177B5M9_9BILA|nr:hypothetical protein A3Q56_02661 [Intoshia linei]
MIKVKVRWGKKMFKNVECNMEKSLLTFQETLAGMTGVTPIRQKLIVSGKLVKDDLWKDVLNNGTTIMMIGSVPVVEEEVDLTHEDYKRRMIKREMVEKKYNLSPKTDTYKINQVDSTNESDELMLKKGFTNFGNTCYINATLQCLLAVPELFVTISDMGIVTAPEINILIRDMTKIVFGLQQNDLNLTKLNISSFVNNLRSKYPEFNVKNEMKVYQQQDANEFWLKITPLLFNLPVKKIYNSNTSFTDEELKKLTLKDYFRGEIISTCKAIDHKDEPVETTKEEFLQLSCFINKDVRYIGSGLSLSMNETVTKMSKTLNKNIEYKKEGKINRAPGYLVINMMRFYFKENANKKSVNAKILKDVKFSMNLDIYDMCTSDLQKKFDKRREINLENDREFDMAKKLKRGKEKTNMDGTVSRQKLDQSSLFQSHWIEGDCGSNDSGMYELIAVLTHKGRTSNSGHYVGWVTFYEGSWVKLDDDSVTAIHYEDILKLSGGGDWHCAYSLIYASKQTTRRFHYG